MNGKKYISTEKVNDSEYTKKIYAGLRRHGMDARNIQGIVGPISDDRMADGESFKNFSEFILKGDYHNRYNLCLDTMALKTFYCQNGDAQKQAFLVDSVTVTA
jgi:hypothetical protein